MKLLQFRRCVNSKMKRHFQVFLDRFYLWRSVCVCVCIPFYPMHIYLREKFILLMAMQMLRCANIMHTIAVLFVAVTVCVCCCLPLFAVATATATLHYLRAVLKINTFYSINCLHTCHSSSSSSIYWSNSFSNLLPFSSVKVIQEPFHIIFV